MVYVKTNPGNWTKEILDDVMEGRKLPSRELKSIAKIRYLRGPQVCIQR